MSARCNFGPCCRRGAVTTFALAVLHLLAWPTRSAALNVSHNPSQPKLAHLPFCYEHIHKLPEAARESFRDLLQESMLHTRVDGDMGNLLQAVLNPPTDEVERHTWKTHLTADEVRWRRDNATAKRAAVDKQIEAAFQGFRKAGLLPARTTVLDLKHCLFGRLNPHTFPDQPLVSFMLQYFKRPHMIEPLVGMVQACNKRMPVELLVNVDHPGESQRWADLSWSTKGLVVPIFSNNIHEIRAYNNMASLARGKYLIVLQDDELPQPLNCSWIDKVVAQFESMPQLGLVGLFEFLLSYTNANTEVFVDPVTKNDFVFAFLVNFAPAAARKAAFKYIGGLDETFSDPGECGIIADWEMSIRMWVAGWRVGYMPLIRKQRDGVDNVGGTHKPETHKRCWIRQAGLAGFLYGSRWVEGPFPDQVENYIRIQNLRTLQRNDPAAPCPFRMGCDIGGTNTSLPTE